MATIAEIRQKYPQYNDLSDTELADAFHKKYYSDLSKEEVYSKMGLSTQAVPQSTDTGDETQRLAARYPKPTPSTVEQMFGLGGAPARVFKGAVANPVIAEAQMVSRIPTTANPLINALSMAARFMKPDETAQTYEAATQAARKEQGSEGFDWWELLGGVVSPVNRVLGPTKGATAASTVGKGIVTGAASGALTPVTSQAEDSFVSQKLMQMGIGGTLGGAVPLTTTSVKYIKQVIQDMPISKAAKERALQKYLGEMAGKTAEEQQATVAALKGAREIVPGSAPTAAEALAETPAAARLIKEQQRVAAVDPAFIARQQQQQAARQGLLTQAFGTEDDLARALRERAQVTTPLREDALRQANIYGQVAPQLEADIAERLGQSGGQRGMIGATQLQGQTATEAAQALQRANTWTPVPGYPRFPGRYSPNMERAVEFKKAAQEAGDVVQQRKAEVAFKQMQLKSLKDEGFFPLETQPLLDKINQVANTPGKRSNALLISAQDQLKQKLQRFTDENGIINSEDLYNIRKEIGEDIQAFLASRGNPSFGAEATAVEKSLKSLLDQSITKASGSNAWNDYLSNYAKYSQKINRMEVGRFLQQKLGEGALGDVEKAGTFALAVNNAGSTIKRVTGQPRYDRMEDFLDSEQIKAVNTVLADLNRKAKASELAKQLKATGGVDFEGQKELPGFFNQTLTAAKSVLNTLRRGSQKEFDAKIAQMMQNPQELALFLESIPKQQSEGLAQAMMAKMSPQMREAFSAYIIPPQGSVTRAVIQQAVK